MHLAFAQMSVDFEDVDIKLNAEDGRCCSMMLVKDDSKRAI